MTSQTQEEVMTLKLAKNIEAKEGKILCIGSTSKLLGGLNDEDFEKMREFGIKIAKEIGVEESASIIKEVFSDKEFQKELGLESEYCNEYWYIRREYELAKYFAMKKDILEDLLSLMQESLKIGVKDPFKESKIYKIDMDIERLKSFVKDYETVKEDLGLI